MHSVLQKIRPGGSLARSRQGRLVTENGNLERLSPRGDDVGLNWERGYGTGEEGVVALKQCR